MFKTLLVGIALFALESVAHSAIIITQGPPTFLNDGLVALTISAVGTSGEIINTFANPTVAGGVGGLGIHSVAQGFTNAGTPTSGQHQPALWNDAWSDYDSYFLYSGSDLALDLGTAMSETNDGSTTGQLGLPTSPSAPVSGFGSIASAADTTKAIIPSLAGSNVPFFHIAMKQGTVALMAVQVVANGGLTQQTFNNVAIIAPVAPPTPEPTTLSLLILATVSGLGIRRRR